MKKLYQQQTAVGSQIQMKDFYTLFSRQFVVAAFRHKNWDLLWEELEPGTHPRFEQRSLGRIRHYFRQFSKPIKERIHAKLDIFQWRLVWPNCNFNIDLNNSYGFLACGGPLTGMTGFFQSTGYPRPLRHMWEINPGFFRSRPNCIFFDIRYCAWEITVPIGYQVVVDLVDVDLQYSPFSSDSQLLVS